METDDNSQGANLSESLVVLLGAGVSVEAGLPTSNQLTNLVLADKKFVGDLEPAFRRLYRAIAGSILFRQAQRGADPMSTPVNVEDIAEALLLLDRYKYWKFGALFGGLIDSLSDIEAEFRKSGRHKSVHKRILTLLDSDPKDRSKNADRLTREILDPGITFPAFYKQALDALQSFCFEQLDRPSKPYDYLLPLAHCSRVQCVATLNFDTLLEDACRNAGRAYDVAVFRWSRGNLELLSDHLPILKLHGSIDWCSNYPFDRVDENGSPIGTLSQRITRGKPKHGAFEDHPCVLFGSPNKLRASGPFLDLLHKFESELARVRQVAVIGYSFMDGHINDVLTGWLGRSEHNQMCVANGPCWLDSEEHWREFYADWNSDQVSITPKVASQAIVEWCSS